MPVTQALNAAITGLGGGGGGGGPPLTPIDSNTSLGTTWTVEFVCDLYPTTFWATMWGNEVWNAGQGHLAYLTSTVNLNIGSPNAADEYTLAQDVSVKSYWAFTHSNGGGISVYRNGTLLTPTFSAYVQPASPAGNTLLYGSRHNNDGTGTTDTVSNGTFYWTNISADAKDAAYISSQYSILQGIYGI